MAHYRVLLLDADGTLFDYDRAESHAFAATCADLSLHYREADHLPAYRRINSELWRALERGEVDQATLAVERFIRVLEEMGQEADASVMADRYLAHLGRGSFLLPDALDVVRMLSERADLVLLTNGLSRVQRSRFADSGLAAYIPHLVISDEVGFRKPEPEIFDIALKPFDGVDRSQVLMVGDSLSSDILGGARYGIDTCRLNLEGRENLDGPEPTYEIRELMELPSLVQSQ
ncbi:MAG: YjjG family noncanonical pyrimidine nucleotidase [Spirochaetota bacterium]